VPCDNILVQRATLQFKAGTEILADAKNIERLRDWIEQVLGLKPARISYTSPNYASIQAGGLEIAISPDSITVSSRSVPQRDVERHAERIQQFASKLAVSGIQQKIKVAINAEFVIQSDQQVPQGRLLKVML